MSCACANTRERDGRVEIDDAYLGGARSRGKVGARLGEQGTVRRRDADHARRSAPVGVLAPATLHPLGGGGVRRTLDRPVRVRCLRRPVVLWRGAADRR